MLLIQVFLLPRQFVLASEQRCQPVIVHPGVLLEPVDLALDVRTLPFEALAPERMHTIGRRRRGSLGTGGLLEQFPQALLALSIGRAHDLGAGDVEEAGVAFVGDGAREPGPAHHSHATDASTAVTVQLVPAYFPGETADGWRLFREFHAVVGEDPATAALATLQGPPDDPDYESPWAPGSFESARLVDGVIEVELGDGVPDPDDPGDDLSRQQVVYTLQGALQTQAPVQFVRDGEPVGEPVDSRPQNDVLNLVSIADPAEGEAYEGSFTARGRANSFEATVHWQLESEGRVVREDFTTAAGWGDRLYPWAAEVDLTGLPAGTYLCVVREDDPTGGGEPDFHPDVDTRTIVVR